MGTSYRVGVMSKALGSFLIINLSVVRESIAALTRHIPCSIINRMNM
jgi:hypothetical protein